MGLRKFLVSGVIGAQMLFVAFGALVLMPLLTGLDTNVALFTAGAGTLIFQSLTKRAVPVFLASSFVYIAPIIFGTNTWGLATTMGGLVVAGGVYFFVGLLVLWKGSDFITKILPPVVTGPVIMVIGLTLAPVAVNLASGLTGDGKQVLYSGMSSAVMAGVAFLGTVVCAVWGKGIFRIVPILMGLIAGYIMGIGLDAVPFAATSSAPWLEVPRFVFPEFRWEAVLFFAPIALAAAVEHVGDVVAIGAVTGKNFVRQPGLHRTLWGDGLATSFAGLLGGPPNTTYSEVTGAVALTRAFNPQYMTIAAVLAMVLAFVGKLGAFLQSIPGPVMGGILLVLFGMIAAVGIQNMIKAQLDLFEPRQAVVAGVVLVIGIGGLSLQAGDLVVKGIGLSALSGIILNACLNWRGHE